MTCKVKVINTLFNLGVVTYSYNTICTQNTTESVKVVEIGVMELRVLKAEIYSILVFYVQRIYCNEFNRVINFIIILQAI
jgi:hypothetical protein